ncbi:MAG: flavodoxin family protein [Firmicutes bacterium]|nr:flavodoxin family protein [Bacillota bacterium]
MAKVLAVVGSPRPGGNSDLLTGSFLTGARERGVESVEIIYLNQLNLRPCQGCDGCATDGICIIADDMQEIYRQVQTASGVLLASPIYFEGLSAQAKIFIDRFQCWWQAKYRLHKPFIPADGQRPAFLITVGAREDKECFESIKAVTRTFFLIINYRLTGSLYFGGFDRRGSVKEEQWALQKAYRAGQSFAREMIVGGGS